MKKNKYLIKLRKSREKENDCKGRKIDLKTYSSAKLALAAAKVTGSWKARKLCVCICACILVGNLDEKEEENGGRNNGVQGTEKPETLNVWVRLLCVFKENVSYRPIGGHFLNASSCIFQYK